MVEIPSRDRRLFPGIRTDELCQDYFPANTVEVNGESFYRKELLEIHRYLGGDHDVFIAVDAFLLAEPDNSWDENAVAVYIHEKKVGYVPKELAPFFSEFIQDGSNDGYWVYAAVKYVSSLNQFRVRLLVQFPLLRDINNLPFVPAADLPSEPMSFYGEKAKMFNFDLVEWRPEYLGNFKKLYFAGPFPAVLTHVGQWVEWNEELSEPEDAGETVRLTLLGTATSIFESYSDAVLAHSVKKLNGLARAEIHLIWDKENEHIPKYVFSKEEAVSSERIHPDAVYGNLMFTKLGLDWANPPEEKDPF